MQPSGLSGWTPGQPTAVIDLGEEFAPDPSNASTAALQFSAAYYAVDSSAEGNGSKKRKVERACDFCRKRKARCDGPRMPDNVCSNCITNARACTYLEGSKPRGPPKAYIVGLEDRIEKMEALLKRLRPESDFSAELGPPVVRDSWKTDLSQLPASSSDAARSVSPRDFEPSPTISRKQSLVSLTAPPPNRACPTTSSAKSNVVHSRTASGKRTQKPGDKGRNRGGHHSGSDSEHDASYSSLSSSSDTDEAGELSIVRGLKRLTVRGLEPTEGSPERYQDDNQLRFHGKSSSFKLISTTRELIQQHIVETSSPGRQSNSPGETVHVPSTPNVKRPEFWTLPRWEKTFESADDRARVPDWVLAAFPPPDLEEKMFHDFFELNSSTFALLHQPTFERQWREKLYMKNAWFASIGLAIFGVASRWLNDPRVLPHEVADKAREGDESDEGGRKEIWTLAGWGYIGAAMKIHEARRSVLLPPELFEIQSFALIAQYFRGTVAQCGSWFYLSVGLLKAQDVGAHRKKIYGRKPTVEEELWKRAYWHLVSFDRIGSMLIGRPCCSREEDLDLDMPLEVDDEYWENDDPELAWHQPEGKPSLVSGFVQWIKLSHIIAYALKTLYTPNKSKPHIGLVGTQWREQTVDKLNDALLKWLVELPPYLRWRPDMEDHKFASQAATLYTTYHLVQILVYRPFIRVPRPRLSSRPATAQRLAFSHKAVAICLSSARAAAHILDVQTSRGMTNITNIIHVSFVSAGVLLVHLWDLIRQYGTLRGLSAEACSHMSQEISSVMSEIGDSMTRLEEVSDKWELAREMLDEIKDALPASPTDSAPSRPPFQDTQAAVPVYEPAPVNLPSSHQAPDPSHSHPRVSPLTPPEYYGYHQDYVHAPQPSMSRPGLQQYPSSQGTLSFSYDGDVHQLWNMDGAPASPPPLPDFNMFMPPPQQPPQHYAPPPQPAHSHKPPALSSPIYTHPQPISTTPRSSVTTIPTPTHTHSNSGFQSMRPPQPHPIRTSFPPTYHDRHHSQGYTPLPPEYRASSYKEEDEPLGDHECLRLRLLEEAYRQRAPQGGPAQGSGAGYPGPSHHSPDQWVNREQRWT